MVKKIDTRAVGLDTGLALIRWLTGAENLHYGLWSGLEVTAGNLRRAQDAYTERLFAELPPGPLRILDIGGGAGETAKKLLALGHHVEIVVPSAYLADCCRRNAPEAQVHECTFEAFKGTGPFDLCLFSESFQYIPMMDCLSKCGVLLRPGGHALIADCFRTDAYLSREDHGPQPGGGHRLSTFRAALLSTPFTVAVEDDITEAVAPSIDLEQGLYNVIGLGLTRSSGELSAKKPLVNWAITRAIRIFVMRKRRDNLMRRLTGKDRSSDAFKIYNRYMIFKLARES
jgi:SAM-dependent methyltransferase